MNQVIIQLLASETITAPSGRVFKTNVGISKDEMEFLSKIIVSDTSVHTTLEVGCALGFSSVAICSALKDREGASHTIVDPFQTKGWENLGLTNLEKSGLKNWDLISEGSEFALPQLAKEKRGSFDFIFIDGMHTFDHTMIDLFYANLLLRTGGYLVVDDTSWPSVAKAVSYYSRYPAYQKLESVNQTKGVKAVLKAAASAAARNSFVRKATPALLLQKADVYSFGSMTAFKKIAEDQRPDSSFDPF